MVAVLLYLSLNRFSVDADLVIFIKEKTISVIAINILNLYLDGIIFEQWYLIEWEELIVSLPYL